MERVVLAIGAGLTVLMLIFAAAGPQGAGNGDLSRLPAQPPGDAWFQQNVASKSQTVLVEFGAEWCGPCKMIAPHLEELQRSYSGQLDVVKIDVDRQQQLAQYYQISPIPTLLVFKQGRPVAIMEGMPPDTLSTLKEFVRPHL